MNWQPFFQASSHNSKKTTQNKTARKKRFITWNLTETESAAKGLADKQTEEREMTVGKKTETFLFLFRFSHMDIANVSTSSITS